MKCTLCGNINLLRASSKNETREFFYCTMCCLISIPPEYYLTTDEERKRYLHHQNGIEHPGYVQFLQRVVKPTLPFLKAGSLGLDYGCGPSPTLSILLEREKILCNNYDPFFYPHLTVKQYDFIFSTETFEHFHNPEKELIRISNLLKPGGYLSIMTERWENLQDFDTWYYKRDPTHVCFYHLDTFKFISEKFGYMETFRDENRVIILQKI